MGLLTEHARVFFDDNGERLNDRGRLVAVAVYCCVALVLLRRVKFWLVKNFPSNIREYVPYQHDAGGTDTVVVDCTHTHLPTLTHHKESTTPQFLKQRTGDTSTDVVLNALTCETGWPAIRVASKVSCNHFDIDGLTSVWSLIYPLKARKHEYLLRAIARLGDMRELDFRDGSLTQEGHSIPPGSVADQALRFCCWMNAVEILKFTSPFEGDEFCESKKKYKHFLPLIADVLDVIAFDAEMATITPEDARQTGRTTELETKRVVMKHRSKNKLELWRGDNERAIVLRDLSRLCNPALTKVSFHSEINVAFIESNDTTPFHYYASFSAVKNADVVVTMFADDGNDSNDGNESNTTHDLGSKISKYEVEMRYVTFVDYQSRPTTPRLDLSILAKRLDAVENFGQKSIQKPSQKRWDVSGFTDSGPLLRINHELHRLTKAQRYGAPFERPVFPSSIPNDQFKSIVVSFFRHAFSEMAAKGVVPRGLKASGNGLKGGRDDLKGDTTELNAIASVRKVGWTWRETRDAHATVDWGTWES